MTRGKPSVPARLLVGIAATACLAACAGSPAPASPNRASDGFDSGECNLVSDDDVNATAGAAMFTKVVVNDTGCFWQENTIIGSVGAGMGISTWWYRGTDLDAERVLERKAGRQVRELSLDGSSGFEASDTNACSVYVANGGDVITWSIQTLNPTRLPELCPIVRGLAQLTQDRVS